MLHISCTPGSGPSRSGVLAKFSGRPRQVSNLRPAAQKMSADRWYEPVQVVSSPPTWSFVPSRPEQTQTNCYHNCYQT